MADTPDLAKALRASRAFFEKLGQALAALPDAKDAANLARARAERDGWTGPEHDYLSTACWHAKQGVTAERAEELHGYCRGEVGRAGTKVPGTCKWCSAGCQCACHREDG